MCISGVLCPGQAWRTQSLVFSIPSAPASASASAPAPASLGPYLRSPLHVVCPVAFCPASRRFLLSPRSFSLSRPRLFIWVTGGFMGVGGVFYRGLAQRHVRASATFFLRADTGGLFSCPFSLFAAFFLSFWVPSLSLSLSHLHCPGPARLVWLCRSGGRIKCERRIRT
jgi:hypothetical protein